MKRSGTAAVVVLLLVAASLSAETVTTRLEVSAHVLGRTIGGVTSAPTSLVITADDVERGWIDVLEPVALSIRSNQRAGYRLQATLEGPVSEVVLSGLEGEWVVAGTEGWISMPYRGTAPQELSVQCRLKLAPGATPGTYPFPIRIAVAN